MCNSSDLWFSIYNLNSSYKGSETAFMDPTKFVWANDLASNTELIRMELTNYLMSHQLQGYFNSTMVTRANSWKTIALKTWNVQLFKNQKHFPVTTALLNKYPQIISASFNLLEANSKIKPHSGDTNAIYRCHLGLDIPVGLPDCGFKVKDEVRPWENNQWLIFMDSYEHEAWNDSNKDRFIFLMDVLRDEFKSEKNKVCSTVLTSLFLQKRAEKFRLLYNLKPGFVKALAVIHRPFAQAALFVSNSFKLF
jgi:aspartyl/asparaginyl beta-hydroxylase (cupin superfamily)